MKSYIHSLEQPRAITMWDFSWLERSWPGAGQEDWDRSLDELLERGYDAVRIDVYPHLLSADAEREWTILPQWNQQDWGSPAVTKVSVQPSLNTFIAKCKERDIVVGLSSWYQKDNLEMNRRIPTPATLARIWKDTLDSIAQADLMDAIFFVDLCNEWPFQCWALFFNIDGKQTWTSSESIRWMRESIDILRKDYPNLAYTFSKVGPLDLDTNEIKKLDFMDLLEPHIWMVHANGDEFYKRTGYEYNRFGPEDYEKLVKHAQPLYEADPQYWDNLLRQYIAIFAKESIEASLPLITTECWSVVDYKDWPLLDWGWIKRSCACGVEEAASTGRWISMGTSNFCGPQFVGMWRDITWHQEMTNIIKSADLPNSAKTDHS